MAERPEDLNLPTAVVSRIVKEALPEGVNVSKEAKAAISKAASVFVLFATSCANNFAMKAKRKTLTGQDVLAAMEDMEFEKFIEPLKENLELFRRELKGKKEASEKRKKSKTSVDVLEQKDVEKETGGGEQESGDDEEENGDEEGQDEENDEEQNESSDDD